MLVANFVVDVDEGHFGSNDYQRACAVARRGDLRRSGAMPLATCPCLPLPPLWVVCNQDEDPSAEICLFVYSVTPSVSRH